MLVLSPKEWSWVRSQCEQFLLDNLHLDNIITVSRVAKLYRMNNLMKSVMRFCETEFSELVRTEDWLEMSEEEVVDVISSDGVIAAENVIIDSILHWWSSGLHQDDVLHRVLTHVRFSLCPPSYLDQLESDDRYRSVVSSQSYQQYQHSQVSSISNPLSRSVIMYRMSK